MLPPKVRASESPGNGNVGLQNRGPGNGDVRLENLNVDIGSSKRRCIREPDTTVHHQSVSQIGQPSNAIHNRERVELLSNTNVNVPELQTSLGVHQPTPAATFTTSESNSHAGSCLPPAETSIHGVVFIFSFFLFVPHIFYQSGQIVDLQPCAPSGYRSIGKCEHNIKKAKHEDTKADP
ncbi:hypothetical protein Tco_0389965 [Tanacetum coccineum]